MQYEKLASELVDTLKVFYTLESPRHVEESWHGEAFVLDYIANHEGDVFPGTIRQEMGVSSARVATALKNLEKKGLLVRHVDKRDRRRVLIEISPAGKEMADQHIKHAVDFFTHLLRNLGEHDAKEYVRISAKLASAMPDCDKSI